MDIIDNRVRRSSDNNDCIIESSPKVSMKHILFISDTISSVYLYNSYNMSGSLPLDIYEAKILDYVKKIYGTNVCMVDTIQGNLISGMYISKSDYILYELKGNQVKKLGIFQVIPINDYNTNNEAIVKKFKTLCSICEYEKNDEAIKLFEEHLDGYLSEKVFISIFELVLFYDNLDMAKYIYSKDSHFNYIIKRTFVVDNAFSDACVAQELEMGSWLTQINEELDNTSDLGQIIL